jgi:hypothetical protein
MTTTEARNYCRVCGYDPGFPPWGPEGDEPTFDICPCCGVEWGYQDCLPTSAIKYRNQWLADGAKWAWRDIPHDGLDLSHRLARVPSEFQ